MAQQIGKWGIVYVRKCGSMTIANAAHFAASIRGGRLERLSGPHQPLPEDFEGPVCGALRDPWTRQASLWAFLTRMGKERRPFEPWLRSQYADGTTYTAEVERIHGGIGNLDAYFATDRLDEALDLFEAQEQLGFTRPYSTKNAGPDEDYRSWYTDAMIEQVADAEAELIAHFGWEPWEPTSWALR